MGKFLVINSFEESEESGFFIMIMVMLGISMSRDSADGFTVFIFSDKEFNFRMSEVGVFFRIEEIHLIFN